MIGLRTRHSFAQFLELQEPAISIVLLGKYGVAHLSLTSAQLLSQLNNIVRGLDEQTITLVLSEVVSTAGDLRSRVNPKYRFDERMHDLKQCLLLDGYAIESKKLIQTDPSVGEAAPVEDDLVEALRNCTAPQREAIISKINDSAQAFRATPPDFNAALINARVALETLAADVAADVAYYFPNPATYDPARWGSVIEFLRKCDEITLEEELGLAGVFGFLSPGAHRPVGISQDQMTRLGRSFALNMCWFLLKNRLAKRPS